MLHKALIASPFGALALLWSAPALGQALTPEQAERLAPGFVRQCQAEIAGGYARAGMNGMPVAAKMQKLDGWVGSYRNQVLDQFNYSSRTRSRGSAGQHWAPIIEYFYCQTGYLLAHWDDAGTNPAPMKPSTKVAPKVATPSAKLASARPARTAPWSPRALSTDLTQKLSANYAGERADALASCSAPIQQFATENPALTMVELVLLLEGRLLEDQAMSRDVGFLTRHAASIQDEIESGKLSSGEVRGHRAAICLYGRRIAQLEGSPLAAGAVDGSLTPLSIGGHTPPWKQQGKDARVIASDGKSAMDCVKLVELTKTDSSTSGGGRVVSNQCDGPVEVTWCINPGECDRGRGNAWTVAAGRSWPVSATGDVRWAACHGANTAAFVKGSFGLRYYCSAPAKK